MSYQDHVYIASCVFTRQWPELSAKIQKYISGRFDMRIARCCADNYKVQEFVKEMPDWYRAEWSALPPYLVLKPTETMVSLCHNCSAIFEETQPNVRRKSLWELILEDEDFPYPNYGGEAMTVQDCWHAKDNLAEQKAVRLLLKKMDIVAVELPQPRQDFCGISLLRPSPARNLKLAPNRFVVNAQGKFIPHTPEQQKAAMVEYCRCFTTKKVAAYCHYCVEGLKLGGAKAFHLAQLLFEPQSAL